MKNKYNRGFTLVELLAVIAILGIVVSITVYVGIKSINSAKEKSYKTTKNNIERMASTYLEENGDRLFYISNNANVSEYQCITIENLIDGGYFKNDVLNSQVSKDDKVKESDYIYLERDINTKAIKKNVYVVSQEYESVCSEAVKAEEDISFIVSPLEWSKTKDITITYKLKNANNINDYEYEYSYSNNKIESISDGGNVKMVKVSDNGTLTGIIKYLGEESYSKNLKIDKIDNIGPVIKLGSNKSGYVREKVEVSLEVSDFGIGVDSNSFTKDDVIVKVGDKEISQDNLTLTIDNNGSVKLVINNKVFDGNVNVQIKVGGVLDKLGNSNDKVEFATDIIFDNTAPSKPDISNPSNGNWTNSNIKLGLSTEENGSGIDYWQYTYNESANSTGSNSSTNWVTYSNSSSVNYTTGEFSQERNQLVYVRACDKVGNCSEKSSTYIRIDKTGPTGNITLSYNNKILTASGNVSDALSGFTGGYEWKISTSSTCDNTVSFTSSNTLAVNNSGVYYACARVYDNAGNVSYIRSSSSVSVSLTKKINIYGAESDNISIYNSSGGLVGTVSTDVNGNLKNYTIEMGEYTFRSNVTGHEKNVVINSSTTEVGVYPDNSYFWYGNGDNSNESLYKNSGGFSVKANNFRYSECNFSECTARADSSWGWTRRLYMSGNAQSNSGYILTIGSNKTTSAKTLKVRYDLDIRSREGYSYCKYKISMNGTSVLESNYSGCNSGYKSNTFTKNNQTSFSFSYEPSIIGNSQIYVYAVWYE